MTTEVWKNIPLARLEDYQVSNLGRVRHSAGKLININIYERDSSNYFYIHSLKAKFKLHTIVFITFNLTEKEREFYQTIYSKKPGFPFFIKHKNSDKDDNRAENLYAEIPHRGIVSPKEGEIETWKPIPLSGFENYRASSIGNIQKYEDGIWRYLWQYEQGGLNGQAKALRFYVMPAESNLPANVIVGKLIQLAFNDNEPALKEFNCELMDLLAYKIIYKDNDGFNNRPENLEWYLGGKQHAHFQANVERLAASEPMDIEEWRSIPIEGFDEYLVGTKGGIAIFDKNKGTHVRAKTYLDARGYLSVVVRLGDKKRSCRVHRLVCAGYNDWKQKKIDPIDFRDISEIDRIPFVVNHKNSNTVDNRPENLEWVTQKENVRHAIENGTFDFSGLYGKYTWLTEVTDTVTGEKEIFLSLNELSDRFKLSKDRLKGLISNPDTQRYQGRYSFKSLTDTKVQELDIGGKGVLVLDYATKAITIYNSPTIASRMTGVQDNSIRYRCNNPHHTLIAGYDFFYVDDIDTANPPTFKDICKEEVMFIREEYFKKQCSEIRTASNVTEVRNLETGEIVRYSSLKEASRKIQRCYDQLKIRMRKAAMEGLEELIYNGYGFKTIR